MNNSEIKEALKKTGIVPVVVLDDVKDAKPLADALCRGGLPCAEVTFRTEAAEESIKIMKKEHPILYRKGCCRYSGNTDTE